MTQFNVLWWDFNKPKPEPYDVLPYFRREYKDCRKKPVTRNEWLKFVRDAGIRMYWARCEYEMLVFKWPSDPTKDKNVPWHKVDIWQQIEPNIDLIVDILMAEYYDVRES